MLHFLNLYSDVFKREGVLLLHDEGNAFFPAGVNVFKTFGIGEPIVYTPAIHHWLSPNDNTLHAYAKGIWRKYQSEFTNDLERSLYLLNVLNKVPASHVRGWFSKNMMFGKHTITKRDCEKIFRGDGKSLSDFHEECLFSYRVCFRLNGLTGLPLTTADAESSLDGRRMR